MRLNLTKIANLIKTKRKELGLTQDQLAAKIFVTEKAISRWETGKGTPDISRLIPLAKELKLDVTELLNGEENKKVKNDVEQLIEYDKLVKSNKYNRFFKLTVLFYALSALSFLTYLRLEYDPAIELNYFIRLLFVVISSILVIIGNKIYSNNYVEKIEDQKKMSKISHAIVFAYYASLLFNTAIFARYNTVDTYNLIPFKSIIEIFQKGSIYSIIISILGNLLVFMPLEYFLIELFSIKKLGTNLLISFAIILAIELTQFTLKIGVLDIDDLILCVSGMMLFYFTYSRFKKAK